MRRLLRGRIWVSGGTSAEDASIVLAAVTLLLPLLLFLGASWFTYHDTHQQAEERMARTLDLLYGTARATFETQSLVISNVGELIHGNSAAEIRANERKIHDQLHRLVEKLPQIEEVFVLDAEGVPLVAANAFPMPPGVSASDRPYFIAHRDDAAKRFVSETFRSRVKAVDVFQYSERREQPDGGFNGVIIVAVPPDYFVRLFSQALADRNYTAALVRADGQVLARYPSLPNPLLLDPNSGFMRAIAGQPESGRYVTERSGFDGLPRVFMFRKLPDLPVYVTIGLSTDTIRSDWIDRMLSHLIFGIPATLALFALAVVASRRSVRQGEALARLQQEQARRESAEEGLRQSQKMTAVGQLTAGIAHDFNNLLTGIGGAIEMIGRRIPQPTPELNRFLDLAATGVSRAAMLTQRMLAFARQQPLEIETLDANKLVAGMSELLRRTLGEQIRIETVLAGGLWRAKADVAQLESAILNLAINGRDAMPQGGTLTIETANAHLDDAYALANGEVTPGQYVLVAVSDTGTGMDRETRARAFEPFFTTKERGHGTGLGLSMTFGYIKQIGGHLQIYSEPGQGTVVKIYLPRAAGEESLTFETAVQPALAAGTGPIVLVVEDDPAVREFAVAACREIGCTVYQAGDGEEALRILAAHDDIALLFTDVGLPRGMNGRQLAAVATGRWPRLKVLFTTGYTANAIVHHGVLDSGVNFIGKPFSIVALAAKIKSLGF